MAFPQKPDKPTAPSTGQPSPVPSTPPDYDFPEPDPPITIPDVDTGWDPGPPAPTIDRGADFGPTEYAATFAAKSAKYRLSFGINCRVTGQLFAWAKSSAYLYLGYEFGYGETAGSIGIYIDGDKVVTGGTHAQENTLANGAGVRQYHGTTTQGVDNWLSTVIPSYADDMIFDADGTDLGIKYLVLRFLPGTTNGLPNVEWNFKGLEVRDPRNGHASAAVESDNPSCILSHLITNTVYGQGKPETTTLLDSVETNADNNDELVPLVTGEKRHTLNITLDVDRDTDEWINIIAGDYAECWVVPEGESVKLVPDRPDATIAKAFTADDIVNNNGASTLESEITGPGESPTVVTVWYTDIATEPETGRWGRQYAQAVATGVDTGVVPRRNQDVTLPGIQDHSEAKRAAIKRLNAFTLQREIVRFVTFDEGVRWQKGDHVTLTHWRGYSTDDFRVVGTEMIAPGRWRITFRTYDASVYTDAVESAPAVVVHDFDDPFNPPVVTELDVSDHVQQFSTHANLVLRITWTDPSYHVYPQTGAFRIVVTGERDIDGSLTNLIHEGFAHSVGQGNTNEYTTPGLLAPRESTIFGDLRYKVDVYTRSAVPGVESAAVTTTYTAIGKGHPPGNVQRLDAEIVNGKVELSWPEVYDLDLIGYLVRESPAGTINQAWASMTPVPSPGGRLVTVQNRMVIRSPGEPDDVIEYAVKAIDSGRRQSADEKRTQVLLTDLSTSPSEKIEHWPRTGAWALDVTLDGFYDILIPGDGWYFIAESDDHDIDQRWGTSSPANNVDKPPHYGNDSWTTHSSPDPRVLALFKTFSGGFEMREFQWQMYKEEWDEDANIVTTGLIAEYQTGINTGHTPTTQGYAGQSVVANADKIRWLISFPKASLPDGNWSMVIRAPIVISGQKAVLEQSATMTGLASSYPKTATLDNTFWKKYNSAPLVNLTVETNNASARLTAAPTTTLISVDVLPDSGDPTVTVRWIARGS